MIYWFAGIALCTFLLGFVMGTERGYRNAHQQITINRLKSAKSIMKKAALESDTYDPMWSHRPKLQLVKEKDDTRE